MKNLQVYILAGLLTLAGIAIIAIKVIALDFPMSPAEERNLWTVETRIGFQSAGIPIKISLDIPRHPPNYVIFDEDFIAPGYGFSIDESRGYREAQWAKRTPFGEQILYYRVVVQKDKSVSRTRKGEADPVPAQTIYVEPFASAIKDLLTSVEEKSADTLSFTKELINQLTDSSPEPHISLILSKADNNPVGMVHLLVELLAGEGISAQMVQGLILKDGMIDAGLTPWLEVYAGDQWSGVNPKTGAAGYPDDFLLWHSGSHEPWHGEGMESTLEVSFSARKNIIGGLDLMEKRAQIRASIFYDFSLLSLPLQTQNIYRLLFVVPFGALIVVLVRNIIGIKTFGTFMPVLIALAFRETRLFWGIILFVITVGIGLSLRFYLERLKLLLVPRLASVLVIVILIMAFLSVAGHHFGIERGLSVALFPMVILAMTIERMSVVWEENGSIEALQQGIGSILVASLAYAVMNQAWLQYWTFVFPEILLILLAILLLLGRYTGYRLSEYYRFRSFTREMDRKE